jgi:hypothetical protein
VKPGDLVRLRASIGMPNQSKALGIVRKIRPKPEGSPYHSNREWDSVLVYWRQGHRMNERWVVRGSLEVISEGR